MAFGIDASFVIPANAQFVEYVQKCNPSAHSDVASELTGCAGGLTGVRSYCPNPQSYAYQVLYTARRVIFAAALGMKCIALRLSEESRALALADRGEPFPQIGPDWIAFDAFDADEPTKVTRARLAKWCRIARQEAG